MGLLLTGTQDQALLAFVISEARKVADQHRSYLGRTAVQKIMYFLNNAGVPMRYRFVIHHFGPFCEQILSDSELLIADSVIEDQSTKPKYSDYAPGEALDELVTLHRQAIEPWRETIENAIRNLAPFDADIMEATATLDYIYREQLAIRNGNPTKESVIAKFMKIKGDKFQQQDIERLYDAMCASKAFN